MDPCSALYYECKKSMEHDFENGPVHSALGNVQALENAGGLAKRTAGGRQNDFLHLQQL